MLTLSTAHTILYCSLYLRYNSTKHNMEKKKQNKPKKQNRSRILCFLHSGFVHFSFFNIALKTFPLHNISI